MASIQRLDGPPAVVATPATDDSSKTVDVPQVLSQPLHVPPVARCNAPAPSVPAGPRQEVNASVGLHLLELGDHLAEAKFVPPSAFAATLPLKPIIRVPFPDPGAVKADGVYTMVGTSNETRDTFALYQATHRDGPWRRAKDADGRPRSVFTFAQRPEWIHPKDADRWAPELHQVDDKWVCVYTARHRDGDLRIAAAVADDVLGPYRDLGPLLAAEHGVIDSTIVRDRESGQWISLYKNDDNSVGKPTPIIARAFELDGDEWVWKGEPHEIARSGEGHGGLLEGPWVVHENGTSWITLSSDYYGGENYKAWIGRIDDLMHGEVEDLQHLLTTASPCLQGQWMGPGHNSLVKEAPGIYSMYFHAWPAGAEVKEGPDASDGRAQLWNNRFVAGEGRKTLRVTLAFIDERGKPCPPYIVEDRIKA